MLNAPIKNTIIHLIGFPGTGKLTIAKEMMKICDARLIDNHSVNNVIFNLIETDGVQSLPKLVWKYTRRIWDAIQDTMIHLSPSEANFILTGCLLQDQPQDHVHANNFRFVADMRGGIYIPIRLVISDIEEHKKRITSPQRKVHLKSIDATTPDRYVATKEVLNTPDLSTLTLDVTRLTAEESARKIIDHIVTISSQKELK